MDQVTTSETVALSAPVLEGLRRLDAVMKMRQRQTAAAITVPTALAERLVYVAWKERRA